MLDLLFLTDPSLSSQPWEIVVAAVIIVITGVSLFFLYRNVIFNFKKNKLERKSLQEDNGKEEKDNDVVNEFVSSNPLLAAINEDIKKINEGDLRLFFAINLDNFRYIVDSYEQKDVDKIIDEFAKRLKRYCGKNCITGHYAEDVFIYYHKGEIDNEKINDIGQELLNLFKQPTKLGNHELTVLPLRIYLKTLKLRFTWRKKRVKTVSLCIHKI